MRPVRRIGLQRDGSVLYCRYGYTQCTSINGGHLLCSAYAQHGPNREGYTYWQITRYGGKDRTEGLCQLFNQQGTQLVGCRHGDLGTYLIGISCLCYSQGI